MESKIIILNGSGGSGKDTFVNCVEEFINTYHYSSITKIKEIALIMGWDGGKTEEDRKLLSDLKLLSSSYNNLPFEEIKKMVDRFKLCNQKDSLLFIDIREPDEIKKASETFNAVTILITNKYVGHIKSNMADENVFNYKYDYVIENDGDINDLRNKAKRLVDIYKEGRLDQTGCPYYNNLNKDDWKYCLKCKHGFDDDGALYCKIYGKGKFEAEN